MEKRPIALYLLVFLLAIQSLGALSGGLSMVMSPSGELLKMPLSVLAGSPFSSFLVPGLILLFALGFFPGLLVYAALKRPEWKWAGILNIYSGIHWTWSYSLYLGIMLIIWILLETRWIAYDILQTIFGMVGVLIVIATLLPATMHYFGWNKTLKK